MPQPLHYLKETASQTAGPFVHIGLAPEVAGVAIFDRPLGATIAAEGVSGERIAIEGTIYDGNGAPVRDAIVESWQADASGNFAHPDGGGGTEPGFRGWGRVAADLSTGLFRFETVKPGPVDAGNGSTMAPHVLLWIVARGINLGLLTRLYFADEEAANAADPVLARVDPARRETLLAHHVPGSAPSLYRFDVRLQGEGETVFFDV